MRVNNFHNKQIINQNGDKRNAYSETLCGIQTASNNEEMNTEKVNNKIINKSITVNCSLDTVWLKWTTHQGLKTFFGPDNKVDLKLGGAFEIYFLFDNPKGLKGGEGCQIISFLPKKMLSFTWNAPPQYPEIRNHEHKTWVVVNFKSINNKQTTVELSHLGWLDGEKWDEVFNYFDSAWDTVLKWLEECCDKEDKE